MAKYYGAIGYAIQEEVAPGVWEDVIKEKNYRGDIINNQHRWQGGEGIHEEFNIDNSISIVADDFVYNHMHLIKYVTWYGARYKVQSLSIKRPRLILQIGGVYNGPTPD